MGWMVGQQKDAPIHAPRRARTSEGARGIGRCGEGRVKSAKRFYETVFALLHPRIPSLRLRIHFEIPKYQMTFAACRRQSDLHTSHRDCESALNFCGSARSRWALHGVCGVGCGRARCRHVSIPCVACRYAPQQGGGSPPTSVSKW